jgi:hypothetical protein
MLPFASLMVLFLIGFATAFAVLGTSPHHREQTSWLQYNLPERFWAVYLATALGDFDPKQFASTEPKWTPGQADISRWATVLFVVMTIIINVISKGRVGIELRLASPLPSV